MTRQNTASLWIDNRWPAVLGLAMALAHTAHGGNRRATGCRIHRGMIEGERQPSAPYPLEAELGKIQKVLDALDECPPLWWADKLL